MIAEPKPPMGLGSEAAWHRQLLRWIQGWFVLSIEDYRVTETTNGRVFKKISGQSAKTPPFTQEKGMFPFRIYKPDPLPPDGFAYVVTFDEDGNAIPAKIDSTNPTDFTASPPTINPTTDAWRFWRVRGGEVEVRPYYSLIIPQYYWGGMENGALRTCYPDYTDSAFPFTGGYPYLQYDDLTDGGGYVLIIPNITGTYNSNDDVDYVGNILFSIWIEIIPDASEYESVSVSIKGKRFSIPANMGDIVGANQFTPFPANSPFVIPIGIVGSKGASYIGSTDPYNLLVEQIVSANIINRWSPGMFGGDIDSYGSIPGALCYRGDWNIDDSIQDMVFYPGDVVRICNTITGTDTISYHALQFTGTPYGGTRSYLYNYMLFMATTICFTSDPSADNNFICISACGTLIRP